MDPLSVTLAAVSLTTAIKDLVELGQKIHESFARISKNSRRAQRVAEEIQEMVEELKVFCDDHQNALAGMNDFHLALQGLLVKFRSFELSILPLLPQTGTKRRDRFFRGWDAWRNSNKIEGSIVDLQSDIIKVIRRYMIKSTMRTEVKLDIIHQETAGSFTGVHNDITQGLEVLERVRRDVSALRLTTAVTSMTQPSYEASWATSDEFNRSILIFANSIPSTSAPILRTPNVITEELLTNAYVKFQLNGIAIAVDKMSQLHIPVLNIGSVENFCLFVLLKPASMNITSLRHNVVRQVTDIRDLLDTKRMYTISIYEAASALNVLSTGLKVLHLIQESILVGKWAIKVARILVEVSGGKRPDLQAALALYLLNQSVRYGDNGDNTKSLLAIEEAYKIAQHLRSQYSGAIYSDMLHSDILSQYSQLVDNSESIKMSIEAVRILENIVSVQAFTQSISDENVERVVPSVSRSSFLDNLFSSAPSTYPIISYARTLQRLGTYSFKNGQSDIALELYRLAIAMRQQLVTIYGHEYKAELAMALSSLVRHGTASCIPAEELVGMADECIQLLRALVSDNPLRYARQLVSVLWTKAAMLDSLDRNTEAVAAWEEVTGIAEQIIQDSAMCATALCNLSDQFRRLERHDDAVRVGTMAITMYKHGTETQALRYLHLSNDLRMLQRYKESVEAARTSVSLYRSLATKDLGTWVCHLTGALSTLARCLAAVGHYSEALMTWQESVVMLDNFLATNPDEGSDSLGQYLAALSIYPSFGNILEDAEKCLHVCSTAVQYVHRMSSICPHDANITTTLLWCEFCYAYSMLRVGSLQAGLQYIDHYLDVWSNKSLKAISELELEAWHAMMVALKADTLDARGCTEQALSSTQKVHEMVKLSPTTYQPWSSLIIDSMVREARLQVNLGNSLEALQNAERALQLSRDNKPQPIVEDLLLSLHAVAFTALSCRDYKRATEAAQEGCNLYNTGLKSCRHGGEHDIFLYPGLFAILSCAEAHLGQSSSAVEHAHRAVNMSLDIRDMRGYVSITIAEHSYMETRGNLAEIYLVTGDLTQARQICEERKAYFSKRVEKRIGDYRELVPILCILGVLYCGEGRHEDGKAMVEELTRIMRTLRSAFSSLHQQVKNRLCTHITARSLKVLGSMSQEMDCKHQTEILSGLVL